MKHRHRTRLWTLFAALALALVVLPTGSASATVGSMEVAVDTTLTEDHNGQIQITADNVTLDCAGHKVIGPAPAGESNVGIKVHFRSGVAVRNCDVSGFAVGINLWGTDSSTVEGNTTHDNVGGEGGAGIALGGDSTSIVVRNNVSTGNTSGGIHVHSDGNTVEGNTVTGNGDHGIFVDTGANGNTLTGNEAHRNGSVGVDDDATVGANLYSKNHCTGNKNGGSEPSGLCQEEPVGLVNPSSGEWHLRHSENSAKSFYYGNPGDVPFMGDWDCDTVATPGLFRQSDAFAYLRNSNTQGIADIRFFFGNPSDIPLAGDFNGDGCDTLSIYRPSEARFYIINKLGENEGGLGAAEYSFLFGNPGDKPVVGDWDGDGIDEIGLHRETSGFFYYRNTLTTGIADGQFFFGDPGDRFVSGDWGVVDGVDTPAMFRPSNSTFYFRHTLTQGIADSEFVWTGAGMDWLPVSGDFTLD